MRLEALRTRPGQVWRWLCDQITQNVPDEDAVCEFDCRREQCGELEWATCQRRIARASGELWPGLPAESSALNLSNRPPATSTSRCEPTGGTEARVL
jgi:hypothetical protein